MYNNGLEDKAFILQLRDDHSIRYAPHVEKLWKNCSKTIWRSYIPAAWFGDGVEELEQTCHELPGERQGAQISDIIEWFVVPSVMMYLFGCCDAFCSASGGVDIL